MTHAHFACSDYFFKRVICHTSLGVVSKDLKFSEVTVILFLLLCKAFDELFICH